MKRYIIVVVFLYSITSGLNSFSQNISENKNDTFSKVYCIYNVIEKKEEIREITKATKYKTTVKYFNSEIIEIILQSGGYLSRYIKTDSILISGYTTLINNSLKHSGKEFKNIIFIGDSLVFSFLYEISCDECFQKRNFLRFAYKFQNCYVKSSCYIKTMDTRKVIEHVQKDANIKRSNFLEPNATVFEDKLCSQNKNDHREESKKFDFWRNVIF